MTKLSAHLASAYPADIYAVHLSKNGLYAVRQNSDRHGPARSFNIFKIWFFKRFFLIYEYLNRHNAVLPKIST